MEKSIKFEVFFEEECQEEIYKTISELIKIKDFKKLVYSKDRALAALDEKLKAMR